MTNGTTEGAWQKVDEATVYDNHWINVTHHNVINPSSGQGIYGVVRFKHLAVGVLAIDASEQIVLVGQYRYPLQRFSWEIPEGGCRLKQYCGNAEPEEPIKCAERELLEEAGIQAGLIEPLLTLTLSNSITNETANIFLATQLKTVDGSFSRREPTEADMQIKRVSLQEAVRMIDEGEIDDAITVAAIYKYFAEKVLRQ